MVTSRILSVLALLACAAAPAGAQSLRVTWSPEQPVVGTLFVVRVDAPLGTAAARPSSLSGRVADEPLHFQDGDSVWSWAVAAVPIDAQGSLELALDVSWADGSTETITRPITLAAGSYRMERLTVAPEFGSPLSPELQRRTEEEAARAMRVAQGAHDTPPLWAGGGFARPRATVITSGFGSGREFNGQVQSRHMGTDFRGGVGEPVLAPADGIVRIVDRFYLGGNVVYLDHGGGLSTAYLHLSEALVQPGDTVRAGQSIGKVGATGRVTGPHLHWIVRYGNVTVDPLSVVALPRP
jgi:murein DD-endopeptidase MepM/ murein hydrolase activator NlpD